MNAPCQCGHDRSGHALATDGKLPCIQGSVFKPSGRRMPKAVGFAGPQWHSVCRCLDFTPAGETVVAA